MSKNGLLFGRYRLVREVARTEAGALFEALDAHGNQFQIGKLYAVEVANALPNDEARERFMRDAQLAQRLTGVHVLGLVHVGTLTSGIPCIVREPTYSDVESETEAHGPVPLAQAVEWTLAVCEALAEGHAIGIAHGDVRPANVMLAHGDDGPIVKLNWTTAAKADGVVKEDIARDIAGAANVLRVLATGIIGSFAETDQAPTMPQGVAGIVARALSSVRPYANILELAQALAPHAPNGHRSAKVCAMFASRAALGTQVVAPARPPLESVNDAWFSSSQVSVPAYTAAPRRRSWAFPSMAAALVLLAAGGTYAAWRTGAQEDLPKLAAPQQVNSDDTKTEEQAIRTTNESLDGRSADLSKLGRPKHVRTWTPATNEREPVGTTTITSAGIGTSEPAETPPATDGTEPAPTQE